MRWFRKGTVWTLVKGTLFVGIIILMGIWIGDENGMFGKHVMQGGLQRYQVPKTEEEKRLIRESLASLKERYQREFAFKEFESTPMSKAMILYPVDEPDLEFGLLFAEINGKLEFFRDRYVTALINKRVWDKRKPLIDKLFADLMPMYFEYHAVVGDSPEYKEFEATFRGSELPEDVDVLRKKIPGYLERLRAYVMKNVQNDPYAEAERIYKLIEFYREQDMDFDIEIYFYDDVLRQEGKTEDFLKSANPLNSNDPLKKYKRGRLGFNSISCPLCDEVQSPEEIVNKGLIKYYDWQGDFFYKPNTN